MRYYHVFCRICEFRVVNTTQDKAQEAGIDHYYNMSEEGHHVKWFDSVTPYMDGKKGKYHEVDSKGRTKK